MKKFKFIAVIFSFMLCFNSYSKVLYVSDNIYIFTHSGPSSKYRIVGRIKVGDKVDLLQYNKAAKFMEVKYQGNKKGWVAESNLQELLPAQTLIPALKAQLSATNKKLSTILDDNKASQSNNLNKLASQKTLIKTLQVENATLQKSVLSLKSKNLAADLLQATRDERIKMEWMINGGGVLFFGLILGIIIPRLPRRKKKKDNW
ncbi:MAG: TIGR04211 family SH3 domain-containing protein [Psychromonas sp.]|nr:TIGR04211 family SH3 domain-containing protein [Psychromonas sp.]